MTKIEWTQQTWNPIVGCSVVSPGCTNCYAMKAAWKLGKNGRTPQYHGLTDCSKGGAVWNGKVAMASDKALTAPLRRRTPTTYFVNSMGDLFAEGVSDDWIDRVFAIMALCPRHTFQVLTKRPERAKAYLTCSDNWRSAAAYAYCWAATGRYATPDAVSLLWPLPNVWLGVSAEDQTRADERIPHLLATPAAMRFVSAEPLLGPIDLTRWSGLEDDSNFGLDWVIVGGESGAKARPMHHDWARGIRDQCTAAGVPFFFKQWGEWVDLAARDTTSPAPSELHIWPDETVSARVGKKAAGRALDGRKWSEVPV